MALCTPMLARILPALKMGQLTDGPINQAIVPAHQVLRLAAGSTQRAGEGETRKEIGGGARGAGRWEVSFQPHELSPIDTADEPRRASARSHTRSRAFGRSAALPGVTCAARTGSNVTLEPVHAPAQHRCRSRPR